ncbi:MULTISPECIES: ABC transporter permease [Kocuria]|uniref:Putative ABC transporter permease n=1 Tax=Kocuria varians TaxID=1272 RepID=A0A7D7L125_KOCVA|nr:MULTISPECIES: ABC transporter permease [Kocuria]QMS56749.1 putative ABC transporter permease [Kocuria varians]RUP81555.1 ABC transporter permease [Kocuria sp. HSID17590]RUQ07071.1 ABC transporter permease [Kocuria sp. HSID17582]
MFLSLRDITFAKGRFALLATVVALITLLLVLLTGLTNGLGHQNTSALERLDAQQLVLSAPPGDSGTSSFTTSQITDGELQKWRDGAGKDSVERLGITQTSARSGAETQDSSTASSRADTTAAAAIALEPGSKLAPDLKASSGQSHPDEGQVVLSSTLADDMHVSVGDTVSMGGKALKTAGVVEDEYYSHVPVVWMSMADFPAVAHTTSDEQATALALTTQEYPQDLPGDTDTVAMKTKEAFAALPAYESERGSLLMMQGFLYGISALVVVSFLTVWTIQRTRDIAVLRALGADRGYVVRDSIVQAAVVLTLGVLVGGALGLLGGLLAGSAVPFQLSLASVGLPVLGVLVLGLLGSLLAVRRVSTVDPMIALGGN